MGATRRRFSSADFPRSPRTVNVAFSRLKSVQKRRIPVAHPQRREPEEDAKRVKPASARLDDPVHLVPGGRRHGRRDTSERRFKNRSPTM
jgi:hypothetical protein